MTSPVRVVRDKVKARLSTKQPASGRPPPASSPDMRRQIARLRRRVEQLEAEVQENRRLNRRLAELTDVVQELLVPISQRDEEKLRERLEKYSESL